MSELVQRFFANLAMQILNYMPTDRFITLIRLIFAENEDEMSELRLPYPFFAYKKGIPILAQMLVSKCLSFRIFSLEEWKSALTSFTKDFWTFEDGKTIQY